MLEDLARPSPSPDPPDPRPDDEDWKAAFGLPQGFLQEMESEVDKASLPPLDDEAPPRGPSVSNVAPPQPDEDRRLHIEFPPDVIDYARRIAAGDRS